MTCLEKYRIDHPEENMPIISLLGCPDEYGYLDAPGDFMMCGLSCIDCWNREIPEEFDRRTALAIFSDLSKSMHEAIHATGGHEVLIIKYEDFEAIRKKYLCRVTGKD